jgi:hypothetical protein
MILAFATVIITHLVIPVVFLVWLWRGVGKNRLEWLLNVLIVLFYSIHIFLSGRWDIFGYPLRYLLAIALTIALFKSLIQAKSLPLYPAQKISSYFSLGISGFIALFVLTPLITYVPGGYSFSGESVELSFPLRNGVYYIAHGGNSPVLNHHNVDATQRYALDITKLNRLGTRATALYTASLTSYAIFEDTLYSPCNGTVSEAVDTFPDLIPPESDRENLAGNYILMQCQGADVVLAHLQKGSLVVQDGDNIQVGQAIAKIGNSGNTSEPHLHIHARRENTGASPLDGEGMAITFGEQFLVRNDLVFGS